MFDTKPLCAADPFDLLLSPQAVLQAVERSQHLGQLRRRICRPLDTKIGDGEAELAVQPRNDLGGRGLAAEAWARPDTLS